MKALPRCGGRVSSLRMSNRSKRCIDMTVRFARKSVKKEAMREPLREAKLQQMLESLTTASRRFFLRPYVRYVSVSALFVMLGALSSLGNIQPSFDSVRYFMMANGDFSASVMVPYRFRIFIPLLARLLPLPHEMSFAVITYASLFLVYLIAQIICQRLRINWVASVLGLFVVFTTYANLYNYYNPYLTDGFALFVLFIMILSFYDRSFAVFSIASVVGILTREQTLFLTPLWFFTREWRRSVLILIVTVGALSIVRTALALPGADAGFFTQIINPPGDYGIYPITHFPAFMLQVCESWGFIWLLAFVGMILIPKKQFLVLVAISALLLCGALFSSSLATSVNRYFFTLSPVMIVYCARLFEVLRRTSIRTTYALLLVLVAQYILASFTLHTNVLWISLLHGHTSILSALIHPYDFLALWAWIGLSVVGIIVSAYVAWTLRDQLVTELRDKRQLLPF
jgi:hypothetical protein